MNSSPAHSPTDYGSVPNYRRSRSFATSINIDSRIARAMDLVKTHMLCAVREEVEPLREKIKNLTERNIELERENHLLRSLTIYQTPQSSDQLTNHNTGLNSGQISNHQTIPNSGQVTIHQTPLTANHHCSPNDISIPEASENRIFRSVDYSNGGCFSVNTQPYMNVAIKQDVRCL